MPTAAPHPTTRRSSPHRAAKPGCRHFLIDNLPDDTRAGLERNAAAATVSLTEHIRRVLAADAAAVTKGL